MKTILATKELEANIGGVIYDVLLIPREKLVDIDYSELKESPIEMTINNSKETEGEDNE